MSGLVPNVLVAIVVLVDLAGGRAYGVSVLAGSGKTRLDRTVSDAGV